MVKYFQQYSNNNFDWLSLIRCHLLLWMWCDCKWNNLWVNLWGSSGCPCGLMMNQPDSIAKSGPMLTTVTQYHVYRSVHMSSYDTLLRAYMCLSSTIPCVTFWFFGLSTTAECDDNNGSSTLSTHLYDSSN